MKCNVCGEKVVESKIDSYEGEKLSEGVKIPTFDNEEMHIWYKWEDGSRDIYIHYSGGKRPDSQ